MNFKAMEMAVAFELENALENFKDEANFTVDNMEDLIRIECKITRINPKDVKLVKIIHE